MSLDLVFQIVNTAVLPMWFLLIFLPNLKATNFLIKVPVIPLAPAVIYLIYVIPSLASADLAEFSTLSGLKKMFQSDEAVLAGWIHYLAFDLMVGMWLVAQNRTLRLSKWLMAPVLLLTFMMGPAGILAFYGCKAFKSSAMQEEN